MSTSRTRQVLAAAGAGVLAASLVTSCTIDTGQGGGGGGNAAGGGQSDGMGDDGVFRVAAFTAGYATPAGKLTLDYFTEQGNERENWEVTLYTSQFDYDKINSDVQTAIGQGADAILAGFPDPRQTQPLVQAAHDAGIPIFSIDGGVEPNPDFAVDVTFDQEQIAEITVDALEEAMGGLEGRDVMVIGHDPHVGIHARSNLAVDMLEEAGATIAGGQMRQALDPGTGRTEALNFVTDYLQANPDGLDGVWVGWDDAALGAVQAINEAGQDEVYVTGVDALAETTEAIEAGGPMYATASQDWIAVADEVLGHMDAYATSATLPEENYVEVEAELVDPGNVDSFEPTLGVTD
ncbi:sugar ABC transporter substrate-binding protein [Georgenia alba]|uniref:Sugar ABC transporter substrate-binding protein n=1 Tax=Georgenia alba TaxID=2233858 RepID=A0ABW2Q8R0_9MICO